MTASADSLLIPCRGSLPWGSGSANCWKLSTVNSYSHFAKQDGWNAMRPLRCLWISLSSWSTAWKRCKIGITTRADAQSLFVSLSRFAFIIALMITKDVLAHTKALSIKLQGRYMDIVKVYKEV